MQGIETEHLEGCRRRGSKDEIIALLDKADERKLRLIYCYTKALIGEESKE